MKTFKLTLLFLFSWALRASAQMAVVNKKGTITAIDSSKWTISGTNIINKNSGNVGVGNPTPTYKLDVTGKQRISDSLVSNTARVITLNSGTINDSLVVAEPSTGILKRVAPIRLSKVDSTTATNGLNLVGKDVRMGGALTSATTVTANAANTLSIATSGSSLNITGLASGSTNDSMVVADATTGTLKRMAPIRLNKVDSTTASNGLNLVGKDVRMGGALTSATTVTANAANTLSIATSGSSLNITGLASGSIIDSLLVTDATTGTLKRMAPIRLNKVDSTTASNGLNLVGKDVRMGGALTSATTVTANAANTLSIATSGSSLNITGLASGSINDSLVVTDATTGALKRIAPIRLNKVDSTTANNGLTLTGKNVALGGSLSAATTITTTATNTLSVAGLQSGDGNDSLVVADPSSGELKRIAPIRLNKVDSTTASNGLTLTGKDITLGGSLAAATTVTANAANTLSIATSGSSLNITGLASGSINDSLVVTDATTGTLKRIAPIRLNKVDSTTASNGLNLVGKDVRMGGALTSATTVTANAANTLSIATSGSSLNITGLASGSINDSLVVADATTGALKRIAPIRLNKVDSTTASNGLTLTGKNVALGGSLSAATTITTTATNTLAVTGLQSGSNSDSLVVWDPSTGVLKKAQQHAPVSIKTTTTQSNSSNTVFLDVNTLQFTTVAGYDYDVTVYLLYNSAATGTGIRLRLNSYSGGNIYYEILTDQSGTTQQGILGYNSTDVLVATGSRKTVGNLAKIKAHIECTSNATFSFQFASEVSGSAITIQPNAHLQYVILD